MDDASFRDFNKGRGIYMADALERSLLLPVDMEDLKEVTRARDSAESGLANAQKQAEDQARHLQEAEGQLQITKEQIVDLKQKLAAVKEGKKVVEWAKDEALRAKERLCLPGHRPSTPRRRPRRRPTTWEWLRPRLL